jgi:hypothetical protein
VQTHPEISQEGESDLNFSLNEENITVVCENWGSPRPEVIWSKDNEVSISYILYGIIF